jgi:hypothetical protein
MFKNVAKYDQAKDLMANLWQSDTCFKMSTKWNELLIFGLISSCPNHYTIGNNKFCEKIIVLI